MTNNTRNAIYACLLLLAITVGACVKDSTVPESIHKQPQDFQLADARKHYEENIENLCFPEIYLKPIIQTKGSNYFHNLKQTPLWDRFNFTENGWSYIYEIPILYNITLKASMGHLTQDGHLKKEDKEVNLQSNLIIQKYKKSGNVHIFLSTVIGYIPEPDIDIEGKSPWLWTGDRRNFTGYQFFTNPDGSFRSAFQYKDSHRTNIILSLYDKNEEYIYPQNFFSISLGSLGTKGEGIQEYKKYCWDCQREFDWTESYCPQCGTMLEELDEITIIPQPDHICDKCNFLIENCVCEDHDYGDEDQCPYCLGYDCSGECRNTGGEGNSGGTLTPDNPTYYLISAIAEPVNAGSINGLGAYKAGNDVTLTAVENLNYIFGYWKGDLSGSNISQIFKASKDIDAIAVFHHKDSECGKLINNYNNNVLLWQSIDQINNIMTDNTRNKKEYGFYPVHNSLHCISGSNDKVIIPTNIGPIDFFTHNHPNNALIPSIADLIGIYKLHKNGTFTEKSKLVITTIDGCLGIEVSNINALELFLSDWGLLNCSDKDLQMYCREYEQMFNLEILGNPNATQVKQYEYTELAIDYYIQIGLKIAHRFSTDPSSKWSYATYENGTLTYKNCLN